MQSLRTQSAVIGAVRIAAADSHDSPLFDSDIDSAAIRTEEAGGGHPFLRCFCRLCIDPDGPMTSIGSSQSPDVFDTVTGSTHRSPPLRNGEAMKEITQLCLDFNDALGL